MPSPTRVLLSLFLFSLPLPACSKSEKAAPIGTATATPSSDIAATAPPTTEAVPTATQAAKTPTAATGHSRYKAGDAITVLWKGTSYPATVLAVAGNEHYMIHYTGFESSWDETVGPDRIVAVASTTPPKPVAATTADPTTVAPAAKPQNNMIRLEADDATGKPIGKCPAGWLLIPRTYDEHDFFECRQKCMKDSDCGGRNTCSVMFSGDRGCGIPDP